MTVFQTRDNKYSSRIHYHHADKFLYVLQVAMTLKLKRH